MSEDLQYHMCDLESPGSGWWEYDARGIPLCKVCTKCRKAKLAQYRREVLRNPSYEADEEIEPEAEVI